MRICNPAEHERELHDFDDDQMVKVRGRSHSAMSTHNPLVRGKARQRRSPAQWSEAERSLLNQIVITTGG